MLKIVKRTVTILKIIMTVSFLFVMIPNEKFVAPVFIWIYAFLIGLSGFSGMANSALVLTGTIYLLFFSRKRNQLSDIFSLLAIFILYIPICFTFKNIFIYRVFISWFTYWFFIAVSITTAFLLIKRLITNKYDA